MNAKKNIEKQFQIYRTLLAIAIALAVAFVFIFIISDDPLTSIRSFLLGPVSSKRKVGNIIEMMTPLLFTGVGVCMIFSANQTNMAVEGGFFMGAVMATAAATMIKLPAGLHMVICLLVGGLTGAVVCLVPAGLFVKFGAKPVVSSIMVNNACLYFGLAIINHMLRDPSAGYMASMKFAKTAKMPELLDGTNVHLGIVIGLAVVVGGYLYLYRSKGGYEIRTIGKNTEFARYSGMHVNHVILKAQLIGGFLAGLGGAVEVLGMYNRFQYQSLTNHGFDGIMIGIMAGYNPRLIPVTALFLAYIRVGADAMQRTSDVPIELVSIITAIIVMLIVAERFLYKTKHKRMVAAAKEEAAKKEAA